MSDTRVFVSRLLRLALTEADGAALGRIVDVVVAPAYGATAPRVLGFVADVQRRRIFVNAGRVGSIGSSGVALRTGTVDLRHFRPRPSELLLAGLIGTRLGDEAVMDIALERDDLGEWDVTGVALGPARAIYRRTRRVAPWHEARALFPGDAVANELAQLRDQNPTDVAAKVHALPPAPRAMLAASIPEEQLADILEELPEDEQVRLVEDMDLGRLADVIEEMEPDDAADLLAAMPFDRRTRLLDAVEPDEADALRRLLRYDATTAGGLMTPEPIVVSPRTSVAEALARVRQKDIRAAVAAQVFVCEPPLATPTGRYLGAVGFQRLLREAPSREVGDCMNDHAYVPPDLPEQEVAMRMAAYNMTGVAVCDEAGRLVGAISIDDVLDRVLPVGWRRR